MRLSSGIPTPAAPSSPSIYGTVGPAPISPASNRLLPIAVPSWFGCCEYKGCRNIGDGRLPKIMALSVTELGAVSDGARPRLLPPFLDDDEAVVELQSSKSCCRPRVIASS